MFPLIVTLSEITKITDGMADTDVILTRYCWSNFKDGSGNGLAGGFSHSPTKGAGFGLPVLWRGGNISGAHHKLNEWEYP